MPAAGAMKYPPGGVATEPVQDQPYVPLRDAARRLHMDRRTLQAAVASGDVRGWARPGPQRLRWYVYEDQLPLPSPTTAPAAGEEIGRLRSEIAALRAEVADLRVDRDAVANLRAQVVALTETNLLLLGAQDDLSGAATALQSATQKYRQALAQFMTPGHPGELTQI